ncbi:MAG: hypothetical protein IK137_02755 [Bacilli bacterium]|nr:hypothetical protein [Bacilli bacterium]
MKKETLNKFREEYTTYLEAANSYFSEIPKLQEELDNDPRAIQIKKLQEELDKDPRTIRLKKLEHYKSIHEYQKREYGHWNYTNSDYAYFETKSIVIGTDTYGYLMRFGPIDSSKLYGERSKIGGFIYAYMDIENFNITDVKVEDAEEFEKGRIVIIPPSDNLDERIRKEFLIGCITMEPEEAAKQLVKKYNTKEGE